MLTSFSQHNSFPTGCSIADELFDSFENLLKVAERRGITYDRIVLENSGVAEPQNIRDQFNEAVALNHPLTHRVHLDTLITVVDSATFIHDYSSRAPIAGRPDLGDGGGLRPVVDLLVEQVECADFIVLNKIDMLDPHTLDSLGAIVGSLNPLAKVVRCEHGMVPVVDILGPEATALVAKLNVEGQHRGAVAAARSIEAEAAKAAAAAASEGEHEHHHEHAHHGHEHKHDDNCKACEKEGHEGGHHHHHDHHHHDHGEHKHGDDHKHGEHGEDDNCKECETDGHDHHHHHHSKKAKKERQSTTAAARFGILSFVYLRRRPFHPQRLKDLVLRWMPVSHNKALDNGEDAAPAAEDSPIRTVLRSKGFMWLSHGHTTAFYWSHAGQHFEIRDEGEWWISVPDEDWPQHPAQRATVMADFDPEGAWGDRRQEIVFIGAGMNKEAISAQLDGALLTDDEMQMYIDQYKNMKDPVHLPDPSMAGGSA